MRGDIDRADHLPSRGIEGVQPVAGRKPDVLAIVSDPSDLFDAGKGAVFAEDFGCVIVSSSILAAREEPGVTKLS